MHELKTIVDATGAEVVVSSYDHRAGNSRGIGFVTFVEEATIYRVVDFAAEPGSRQELLGKFVEVKRVDQAAS